MSAFVPLNPRPFLQNLVNDEVVIRLKWGQTEYKGTLVSIDSYMNIQLSNTEEFVDGKSTGSLGQVMIRCNNVLWISSAKGPAGQTLSQVTTAAVKKEEKEKDKDVKMEEA